MARKVKFCWYRIFKYCTRGGLSLLIIILAELCTLNYWVEIEEAIGGYRR